MFVKINTNFFREFTLNDTNIKNRQHRAFAYDAAGLLYYIKIISERPLREGDRSRVEGGFEAAPDNSARMICERFFAESRKRAAAILCVRQGLMLIANKTNEKISEGKLCEARRRPRA